MTIRFGHDLLAALAMEDENDRPDRIWRVCSYHFERVELDASVWAALPPTSRRYGGLPAGYVAVELSLAIGCDFLPTSTWAVAVEDAEGTDVALDPRPCFGPKNVFQTFICPREALAGVTVRALTYTPLPSAHGTCDSEDTRS